MAYALAGAGLFANTPDVDTTGASGNDPAHVDDDQVYSPVLPGMPPGIDDTQVPLRWWNVLILVNANSPSGLEIVRLYRRYHPQIQEEQIVYLGGLADSAAISASPTSEIITRADFETCIAQPTREHLLAYGLQDQIYVIITTAGMPYRIEDTAPEFADVIKPAGSNAQLTAANRHKVDAATVESELSVLFLIDPAAPDESRLPIAGRLVNPYLGYRQSIKRWAFDRSILARRESFRWQIMWRVPYGPKIEGDHDPAGWSALNRRMSPADLYLTARLDGPRPQGKSPVFAVKDMLERAAQAGDWLHSRFVGVSAANAVLAIDHSPSPPAPNVFAGSDMYNLPVTLDFLEYEEFPIPPGGEVITNRKFVNHYFKLFEFVTAAPAPPGGMDSAGVVGFLGGTVLFDNTPAVLNASYLENANGIIGLMTYGCNGGDGRPANYLLTSGPNGGPLFACAPGAVFSSLESFNAVTFFTDPRTYQGKIGEFIQIGGTAAVGHAFEPEKTAAYNVEYLYSNLLRDDDTNGFGDMSLVEAAFSSMPYLSWSEVVIGDPLMRLRSGPGGLVDITRYPGDVNGDRQVGFNDALQVLEGYGHPLGHPEYDVDADLDEDGVVGEPDLVEVLNNFGMVY